MDKLLLVDGHNLLFQMFFGMPERIVNKNGKAIQGTLGFVGALIKIIKMTAPTHVAVLFDGEHENNRVSIDLNYKANRPDFSDVDDSLNPFSQYGDILDALDFMGIKHAEITDYETDDAIASYALNYRHQMKIVISSFDSDFFQLIDDNTTIFRYRGTSSTICDASYVLDKFGVPPQQYADYKALVGDNADNIKGVDKIGPKTAAMLINTFGSALQCLANVDKIEKTAVRESLRASNDRVLKNLELIKLCDRAKLPFELSELEYRYNCMTTTMVLSGIGLK